MPSLVFQIQDLLSKRGRRKSWLSQAVGMEPSHVSRVLGGKLDARVSSVEKLAEALGARFILIPAEHQEQVSRILGRPASSASPSRTAFDDLFIPDDDDDHDDPLRDESR